MDIERVKRVTETLRAEGLSAIFEVTGKGPTDDIIDLAATAHREAQANGLRLEFLRVKEQGGDPDDECIFQCNEIRANARKPLKKPEEDAAKRVSDSVRERAEARHLVVRLIALEHGEGNTLPSRRGSDTAPPSEFFGDSEASKEYGTLIRMGPGGDQIIMVDNTVLDQVTGPFNEEWIRNLDDGSYPEKVFDVSAGLDKRASSQQLKILMLLLKDESDGREYNLVGFENNPTATRTTGKGSVKDMNRFASWSRGQLSAQKLSMRLLIVEGGYTGTGILLKAFGEPELVQDFSRRNDADPGRFVKWLARAVNYRPSETESTGSATPLGRKVRV